MLILSRRTDESIVIGEAKPGAVIPVGNQVTITILSVKGKQVRIGITAPPEIVVHREEVHDRIAEQIKELETV